MASPRTASSIWAAAPSVFAVAAQKPIETAPVASANNRQAKTEKRGLHTQWQALDQAAKTQFLTDQRRFSQEVFDADRIRLAAVALSFMPGYQLIRARLMPQIVRLVGGGSSEIKEESESYFLYNANTDNVVLMTIPLQPTSVAIGVANSLLGVRLTAETVIDYVKYFGLIVEDGDRQGFLFVDYESEIPWTGEVDEVSRRKFLGALSARSTLGIDGWFDVQLKEEKSQFLARSIHRELGCDVLRDDEAVGMA